MFVRANFGSPNPFMAGIAALAMLAIPQAVSAQDGERQRSVGASAVDAATSPLSDLNIISRDIPPVLLQAQAEPYTLIGMTNCQSLRSEIAVYDDVLGPDANEVQDDGDLLRAGLKAGGKIASGFIPFRGLVRQLSGANAKEQEREAAVYAGIARRSFLKGYAHGRECDFIDRSLMQNANAVLPMSDDDIERARKARDERDR